MAKSHLNTNKQFMIGNGILAFAVIFVVVIFVYMSLRMSRKEESLKYQETYVVNIDATLAGDSLQVFVNDSLLFSGQKDSEGELFRLNRFAEESSLLVVDKTTDFVSTIQLDNAGETVVLFREGDNISKR